MLVLLTVIIFLTFIAYRRGFVQISFSTVRRVRWRRFICASGWWSPCSGTGGNEGRREGRGEGGVRRGHGLRSVRLELSYDYLQWFTGLLKTSLYTSLQVHVSGSCWLSSRLCTSSCNITSQSQLCMATCKAHR